VSCTGTTDDTTGAQAAFAAAKNNAFTLVVDCPVFLHSTTAIDKGIFIDNGTSVQFSGSGKFIVDNMFHPAFVIANSSNITLTNWNVQWNGSVPMSPDFGGYTYQGKFVTMTGATQPAAMFNDIVLKGWLASNRGVVFNETQGWVSSIWVGGVNPAAVFYLTGDTSNVVFSGLKLYVPSTTGGNGFLPMAISSAANWKSNQTVNGKTPETTAYAAIPHNITFSGIDFDGYLMGWQGNIQDSLFENITAHRYGDLQDANGGTVGGIGKWFPPPHLFYINTRAADPGLGNSNVHFSNIVDEGVRSGTARDKGGSDTQSGYANSLKLGCTDCSVDTYTSYRPDGFMDVLDADNMTISNVTATFSSTFINNLYPSAIRFPATSYTNVTFDHMQFTDTTDSTTRGAIGNATMTTNSGIVFTNVNVGMTSWAGSDYPLPGFKGTGISVAINFTMSAQVTKLSFLQNGAASLALESTPSVVNAGANTVINWKTASAGSCTATGAWSGPLAGSGSKAVKVGAAGSHSFGLTCGNSSLSASSSSASSVSTLVSAN
jgi:hypothetical protein